MEDWLDALSQMGWRTLQIILTITVALLYFISRRIISRNVKRYGKKRQFSLSRVRYTVKYLNFIFTVAFIVLGGLIWDISFEGLSVYFVTFFTVAGIALFAAWSILSNVTASIILFFYFPYRIGSKVRIVDGENSIEGLIYDLNFFSILIKNDLGQIITYPNNLALQKAIVILSDPQ